MVVALTGAASGIGRELAIALAAKGCHLALSDINEAEPAATRELISADVKVFTSVLNVSDKKAYEAYVANVLAEFGHVDIVINNAGRSVADGFVSGSIEDFELVMNVNFWGTFYGTKLFLPELLKRPQATIVNVSSVNALIPFPNQSSYNTSKSAIMGLSESLRQELRGTNVNVLTVYPGGVRTNIVKNSKFINGPKAGMSQADSASYFEKVAMTSAPRAARLIVSGIARRKSRLKVGPDAYLFDYLKRLMPRYAVKLVGQLAKM
ncbi:short-subunit dehydrogenase [Marinoscillum furvescens DSM 4134]|uniref:Short-subunit dehydrogenase n=2 Tax=Marinoscillum furvescens TaxID=1026 RepID=A0A3D9KXF2_MARFU|nr:short-subunit dehydrogenase [Marinoscillum furvescens DSM 4134]